MEPDDLAQWARRELARARTRLAEAERNGRELTVASESERVASMTDVLDQIGADYDGDDESTSITR